MSHNSTENGLRGETRTEAILADEFWILERYVDRDGADYLVQQKDREQDKSSWYFTNLAVIQSKFRETKTRQIKIKEEYILNQKVSFHDISLHFTSFFVVIHTGDIDNQEIYMLSAKDILDLWEKDGKQTGKTSQSYVSKKNGHFNFCLKRIIDENNKNFTLRNGTISNIRSGMARIKDTLYLKDITQRGFYLDINKVPTGYQNFDKDFQDLRNKAVSVGDYIIGSLRDTIEDLLINSDNYARIYGGTKGGDLDSLEELLDNFKYSFKGWKSLASNQTQEKDEFINTFESFLRKYHK
jgi:hypothetical protein